MSWYVRDELLVFHGLPLELTIEYPISAPSEEEHVNRTSRILTVGTRCVTEGVSIITNTLEWSLCPSPISEWLEQWERRSAC